MSLIAVLGAGTASAQEVDEQVDEQDNLHANNEECEIIDKRMALLASWKGDAEDKETAQCAPDEQAGDEEPLDLVNLHVVLQLIDETVVQLGHDEPGQRQNGNYSRSDQVNGNVSLLRTIAPVNGSDSYHCDWRQEEYYGGQNESNWKWQKCDKDCLYCWIVPVLTFAKHSNHIDIEQMMDRVMLDVSKSRE